VSDCPVLYLHIYELLTYCSSDEALIRLSSHSVKLYFNAEDAAKRQVSAEIVYAVSKFASDRFNAMASLFLPFVFFAKHDLEESVREKFEETWNENVGGSRAVMLYAREITSLAIQHLDSPKWTIKHSAALAIADVAISSGKDISGPNATIIWPSLEKSLALKTFDGKEKVLGAFVTFVKEGRSFWGEEPTIAVQMKKIAIREAKRNNDAYRPHAFIGLGEYAEARIDIDMFDDVFVVIGNMLEDLHDEDKMDTSGDERSGSKHESDAITAGITALFRSINITLLDPSPLTHLPKLLDISSKVAASTKITVPTRLALYERTKALFEGLSNRTYSQESNKYKLASGFFKILDLPSGSGAESLRLKRAEAAEMIVLALNRNVFGLLGAGRAESKDLMSQMVLEGRKNERSPNVRAVQEKILKALAE
jgi:proteasome component ECM29